MLHAPVTGWRQSERLSVSRIRLEKGNDNLLVIHSLLFCFCDRVKSERDQSPSNKLQLFARPSRSADNKKDSSQRQDTQKSKHVAEPHVLLG